MTLARLLKILAALMGLAVLAIAGLWRRYVLNYLEFFPVDMTGKTVLITGATDGLGKESAKLLASWGADLILPVRNQTKGMLVEKEIREAVKGKKVKVEIYPGVDFADFSTVRAFAAKLEGRPIDVLMNNAGIFYAPMQQTKDGMETVYQVNHLSPFMLTYLLLPSLRLAKRPRVVFVTSMLHFTGNVNRETYSEKNRGMFESKTRYDDTKIMNIQTARSFADRYGEDGRITFNAACPGFTMSNIDTTHPSKAIVSQVRKLIGRDTLQGAMPQITVATHPKFEGLTGRFFSDHCMDQLCYAPCLLCDYENPPGVISSREASDKAARDWTWQTSCKLTGLDC